MIILYKVELLLTGRQRPLQATDVNIQQLGKVWKGFQVTRQPTMIITDCFQSRLVWATFRIKEGEYSSLSSILTCFLAAMSDNNSLVRCNFNSCKCFTKTTSDVHLWNILRKENKDKCFRLSQFLHETVLLSITGMVLCKSNTLNENTLAKVY